MSSGGLFSPISCSFSPFLIPEKEKEVCLYGSCITAFFMQLFSFLGFSSEVISLRSPGDQTFYLDKKSVVRWLQPQPQDQENASLVSRIENFVSQEIFKTPSFIDISLQRHGVSFPDFKDAAQTFSLKVGSSYKEKKGLIHDPAGSQMGTGKPPSKDGAGGLSLGIYEEFEGKLQKIPKIPSGRSILNSSGERVLHTHSHHLSQAGTKEEAIDLLTESYVNAIELFLQSRWNVFHLCAVSAVIYGGNFVSKFDGNPHLDPLLSQVALTLAIAKCKKKNPTAFQGKTFNLFYYRSANNPTQLTNRADQVKRELGML